MTDSPMPWVKVHTRLLEDPRFGRLPDATQARYFKLTMLAGRLDAGGVFYKNGEPMNLEEIAWALHCDVATLQFDIEQLTGCGLMMVNGHGPELIRFMDEQGPTQEEKRASWRARQDKHRGKPVTSDTRVNNVPKSQSQESDKESESEKTGLTTDPSSLTSTWTDKTDLVKFIGIPAKYQDDIIQDPVITPEDLLAELARNCSRQTTGEVRKPGTVTAMNLLAHEMPAAEWYTRSAWAEHLPAQVCRKFGVVCSRPEIEELPVVACDYTQEEITPAEEVIPVPECWQAVTDQLRQDISRSIYQAYIEPLIAHLDGETLVLTCPSAGVYAWLQDRTKVITNFLPAFHLSDLRLEVTRAPA